MTLLKPACSLIAAAMLAFGGAVASAQEDKPEAPPVRIYEAAELALSSYTVVKRIWAGTWRASLRVPTHTELADAIEAVKAKAADAGADGVVNLHCLSEAPWDDRYFCYGLAIRLKQPPEFIKVVPAEAGTL
jgi:uncharacterized protein YbjQ (UPF0145 family)